MRHGRFFPRFPAFGPEKLVGRHFAPASQKEAQLVGPLDAETPPQECRRLKFLYATSVGLLSGLQRERAGVRLSHDRTDSAPLSPRSRGTDGPALAGSGGSIH